MAYFFKRWQLDLRIWIGMIGVIVSSIALFAIVGRILGLRTLYDWDNSIGMALNTSVELFLVGLGFVWISLSRRLWHDS